MALNDKERILAEEVKNRLPSGAHDYSHLLRVMNYAEEIIDADNLSVDYHALRPMILVHDLVRLEGPDEDKSVELSVKEARKLLEVCGYDKHSIEKILQGVKSHSLISRGGKTENMVCKPETLEEKILFDADKLDALGEIGIARWFMSRGNTMSIEFAAKTYLKIIDNFVKETGGLYTQHGNERAIELYSKSVDFLSRVLDGL